MLSGLEAQRLLPLGNTVPLRLQQEIRRMRGLRPRGAPSRVRGFGEAEEEVTGLIPVRRSARRTCQATAGERVTDWRHRPAREAEACQVSLYFACSLQVESRLPRHCAVSEGCQGSVE